MQGEGELGRSIHHEEELDSLGGEAQGDALEQVDIVPQHLLVLKIKGQHHQVVDVVVAAHIEEGRLASQVLDQDVQRL